MTLNDIIGKYGVIDEKAMLEVYLDIQDIGGIEEIRSELADDLFYVYVYIYMVGSWQSDGWDNLVDPTNEFNPYISKALGMFQSNESRTAFDGIMSIVTADFFTNDLDDILCRWDEKETDATELQKGVHHLLEILDAEVSEYWVYGSPYDGLGKIIEYANDARAGR